MPGSGAGVPLLAAALLVQVPFGAELTVRCRDLPGNVRAGQEASGWLVTAVGPGSAPGETALHLRPLALGTLTVPCSGAEPASMEVVPSLPPGTLAALPRLLRPASHRWRSVLIGLLLAAAGVAAWRRLHRPPPPGVVLARRLNHLTVPAAWLAPGAADEMARGCRAFLASVSGLPAQAMTGRELASSLVSPPRAVAAVLEGLEFCDQIRFAGQSSAGGPVLAQRIAAAVRGRELGR